jgi:hypothetical protein
VPSTQFASVPVCSTVCEPDRPPDVAEPTLADVERVYPRWHCWKGIAGLVYASLRGPARLWSYAVKIPAT